jgi:thymidine kinase
MNNINVFTGPMKSGKSSTIIRTANDLINNGEDVKVFKPSMDDRFSTDFVQDRNGNKINAININKIDELANYDADSYVIDEFQFLEGNLNVIKNLANRGKKFYIAGLNLTTEKKVFGHMGEIMDSSDNVQVFKASCDCCGCSNAIYSYCTVEKTGDVLVAGDDVYLAVCPECYDKLELSRK